MEQRRSSWIRQRIAAIPFWMRGAFLLGLGVVLAISTAVFSRYIMPPAPDQPIPFSHWFHVSTKKLNCLFCHTGAMRSAHAGLPPVQKCLLCHNVIIPDFEPIAKLHRYYQEDRGVPWRRVYKLPDFVHFNHQPHLARGIDCSACHGDVARMDRVRQAHKPDMNFCVSCHWKNNASDSCYTCHY